MCRFLSQEDWKTQISQRNFTRTTDKDIVRFDITMQDFHLMQRIKTHTDAVEQVFNRFLREWPHAVNVSIDQARC